MYRSSIIARNCFATLALVVAFLFLASQVAAPVKDSGSYFSTESQGSIRESAKFKGESLLPVILFSFLSVVLTVTAKIGATGVSIASPLLSPFRSLPIGYSCIGLSPPHTLSSH